MHINILIIIGYKQREYRDGRWRTVCSVHTSWKNNAETTQQQRTMSVDSTIIIGVDSFRTNDI